MIAFVCVGLVFGLCALTPLLTSGIPEDVLAKD
jgi:hypothetical protein